MHRCWCTRLHTGGGLYRHRKSLRWKLTLGEKSLATLGTRTLPDVLPTELFPPRHTSNTMGVWSEHGNKWGGAQGGILSTFYTLFNYLFLHIYIPSSTISITQIYSITVSTNTVSQLLLIKTFFLQCLQITIRTVQGITALTEKRFSAVSKSVSYTQYTDNNNNK